ncbi:DgyrCDS1301 [Dimorphilus gyrociliatus]|uniref:DgyrCDS1301 n=1 Tax=Dimorphilus gyrociliatus TaxID=2664684 RepID=A0A7I8V8B8_9ANNE|nr:DgyrCDS1301 [Dimorphilus gyrociliatus]
MIVHVVSLGTNHWVYAKIASALGGSIQREYGLFKMCVSLKVSIASLASSCETIKNAPDWLKCVRAMMIIALILLVASFIFAVITSCGNIVKDTCGKATLVTLLLLAAVCTKISWIVFLIKFDLVPALDRNYFAAFGLAVASGLLAIICAILAFLEKPNRRVEPHNYPHDPAYPVVSAPPPYGNKNTSATYPGFNPGYGYPDAPPPPRYTAQ